MDKIYLYIWISSWQVYTASDKKIFFFNIFKFLIKKGIFMVEISLYINKYNVYAFFFLKNRL